MTHLKCFSAKNLLFMPPNTSFEYFYQNPNISGHTVYILKASLMQCIHKVKKRKAPADELFGAARNTLRDIQNMATRSVYLKFPTNCCFQPQLLKQRSKSFQNVKIKVYEPSFLFFDRSFILFWPCRASKFSLGAFPKFRILTFLARKRARFCSVDVEKRARN